MKASQFIRSIVHCALSIVPCAFAVTVANAATWYASPTGTADAACTAEEPGTIQAAFNKAAKGSSWETADEVVLLAGVYDYSDPVWSGKNCVEVPKSRDYITIRSASGNPADAVLLGRGGETYVSEDLLTTTSPSLPAPCTRPPGSASRASLSRTSTTTRTAPPDRAPRRATSSLRIASLPATPAHPPCTSPLPRALSS